MVALHEHHVQAWQTRIVFLGEEPGLAQRRTQRVAETARQSRQWLGAVRIRMLHPQVAVAPAAGQGGKKGRDAVLRVDAAQLGQQPQLLPGEDQLAPGQGAVERLRFLAHEHHMAIVALRAGIASEAGQRGALGQLGGKFGFESLAAIGQQAGRR